MSIHILSYGFRFFSPDAIEAKWNLPFPYNFPFPAIRPLEVSAWGLPTNTLIWDICPQGLRGNVCSLFYPFPQNMLPWWCREETYKSKPAAGSLRDA